MQRKIFIAILALAMVCIIANATSTHAQSGGTYELTWSTIDGGGATFSTGGTYELGGTIGQPDASNNMSGGNFGLAGGFWTSVNVLSKLFLPLITR
jgi:hypothetical protein